MYKTLKVIGILTWLILLSICWCNPDKLIWKISFTCIWMFISWVAYEIRRAPVYPDRFDNFGGGTWGEPKRN